MESQPMKADELGRFLCVADGGCLHSSRTISQDGAWVKTGQLYSSTHRDCFEAWQVREARERVSADIRRGAELVLQGLDLGDRDTDLINLVTRVIGYVMDNDYEPSGNGPASDLNAAINAEYDPPAEALADEGHATAAEWVRSWWSDWS